MDVNDLSKEELNSLLDSIINNSDEESLLNKSKIYLKLGNIDKALMCIIDCLNVSKKYYYEAILIKIDCLIAKSLYIEALKTVEEELSMPYIPSEYEERFKEKDKEVLNYFKDNSNGNKLKNLDDEELSNMINSTDDYGLLQGILEQLYYRNIRIFLPAIEEYLKNPDKDNFMKSGFLLALNAQKVDDEIELVKNGLNITLVPSNLTPLNELECVKKITDIIDDFNISRNVTISEITATLLQSFILYVYPFDICEDEYKYVGLSLYIITSKSLGILVNIEDLSNTYDMSIKSLTTYIELIEKAFNLC